MDGYVHIDSNFVNQKYKPLYPDRTLDRKIEKLCEKVDQLVNVKAHEIVEKKLDPPKPKKIPFMYLLLIVIVVIYIYFKIKSPVIPNAPSVPQPTGGYRPGYE
jgi:hypothetical protein